MCVKAHPAKEYFVVAEKGNQPNIIVYEYPSLRPYSILRGKWSRGAGDSTSYTFFRVSVCFVFVPLTIMFDLRVCRWYRAGLQLCGF